MSSYPVVLLPVALQRALREEPQVPEFGEQAPKPPMAREPQSVNIKTTMILVVVLMLVIAIFVRVSKLLAVLLLIGGLAGILLRAWMQSRRYYSRLQEYDHIMEQYYALLTEFSARASQHQNLVNKALSSESLANFRAALAEDVLKEFNPGEAIAKDFSTDDEAVYGSDCASQVKELLAQHFSHYFGNGIQSDVILTLPQLDNPYVVDFVYSDRNANLYIAIVIDVPYDLNTKTALNYDDAWQDRLTSQALQENGWILLRFAEEHVWRLPKSCCRELAKLIDVVSCKPESMTTFQHIGELPKLKQWSKTQVEQLAVYDYREKYLAMSTNNNSGQNS